MADPKRKTDRGSIAPGSRRDSARAERVLETLGKHYPDAACSLDHRNPLELLVATVLSAQSTDARVNMVTPALFRKFRTAADYADSPPGELETWIRSTGFYNAKARSLRGIGRVLVERHGGKTPETLEELTALPGVGRKTANVVLGIAFGRPEGVTVDTHVGRLARRLGFSGENDPEKVERDLSALFPREEWIALGLTLIFHGRATCGARSPKCGSCPIEADCPRIGITRAKTVQKKATSRRP